MKKPRPVLVCDIDGTLFRSSLVIELVNVLIEESLFPQESRKIFAQEENLWINRRGDYENYVKAVVQTFMQFIRGVSYRDFVRCTEIVMVRHKDKTYRYTKNIIQTLRKKGYYLLAISQSPKTIIEKFSRRLGFHKTYGRLYELGPTNRFTGNVIDVHLIENKAHVLKRAIEKENLTLKKSVGIGDTENDIPFLKMVDVPICFNPNAKLYKYAKKNKWKIIVERKDVIYTI